MKETFVLPHTEVLLENQTEPGETVVVIGIVGKSIFDASGLKVKSIGRMFASNTKRDSEVSIEGYHDEENQIIYLHAHTMLDTDCFIKHYEDLMKNEENTNTDFLSIYEKIKSCFVRTLFVLLYVSHIVVLNHPGSSFDINYIQYFKAVDSMRQKLNGYIRYVLNNVGNLSSEWIATGRPCTPRLIFYFERCPQNVPNLKKLEHNIEDRIYQILKKTRIINSNNCTSLFAIPLNEEFVFMATEGHPDRLGNAVRGLIQGCQTGAVVKVEAPFCSQSDMVKSFPRFLQVHIQQARNKGFDDVVTSSRQISLQPSHFELPYLSQWVGASKAVYNVVMQLDLVSSACTDTRFSEQRCEKVFPMAVARYQEGLPSHYSRTVHESRLNLALNLFGAQARGPKFHEYSDKLIANCNAYWEHGRQVCEASSLTGNPCTLPKHSVEQEHCSGVRYVAACDCGRIQGSRDDPYSAKLANYIFYNEISKECACSALDRINFPVFEPSIKEFKAATLVENEEPLSGFSDNSVNLTPDGEKGLIRQPSTTEYLPGMLTLSSPLGLLPQFSSWSLVCLGPSSLYSHNLGLSEAHQPGFLNSTNYLLPWDVLVYSKSKSVVTLDQQLDPQKFAVKQRRTKPNTNRVPQFTVKVFIGIEYECPRGHRFMLAAPDRVLRATPGSIVKDTGHKVAESDMPLYFPCPCRPGKPLTGQLMRLHVVTPKAPVLVTLNPKVQPAAGTPIFISSTKGPTALTQSTYWIMRLPFIYASDKETYSENHAGRLLQGVFAVNKIE